MNKKPVVAGVGELLWDLLPTGKQMGGAPANFAFHAAQAGCESHIVSAVGNDADGKDLLNNLAILGLNAKLIQKNSFPTGTVSVSINGQGQPNYTIHQGVAWDNINFDDAIKIVANKLDAVCFGSLAQRNPVSAAAIQQLLINVKSGCLKVFDINLRQHFFSKEIIEKSLQLADILKLNDEELPVLSGFLGLNGNIENQLKQLINLYDLQFVVYTMGAKGSLVLSGNEQSMVEAPQVKVTDTVGAGDSFTAVFTTGILLGVPFAEAHRQANQVAAFVCTQKGACPVLPFAAF